MDLDFVTLALQLEREAFVAECPFPLLLAANEPIEVEELFSDETTLGVTKDPAPPKTQPATGRPLVHAVRKVHSMIPHSIILGRASTSDILIKDRQVSKTHALFQGEGSHWELSDAGSRNGSWVGHLRLQPRGDALVLKPGDILSFGHRAFYFFDAARLWQEVRERVGSF